MIEELKTMLGRVAADYADLRYENMRKTRVDFSGADLSGVESNTSGGFVLRAIVRGGMASATFTRPEDFNEAASMACSNARLLSEKGGTPVRFAPVNPVQDSVRPVLNEDPCAVSMEEKIGLVRRYRDFTSGKGKVSCQEIVYQETARDRSFVSTEGAAIREELVTVSISGTLSARDGSVIQNIRFSMGGSDGFARLRGREDYLEERVRIAGDLLSARPVPGGTYNVLLDPAMTGVFTHEAFGHSSEADILERSSELRRRMTVGARLGSEAVSITDDPTPTGQLGFYRYDDEGVPARRVELMKDGVLTGHLHSRQTAASFGEEPDGHCVAEDYRYAPMVRMGCIKIEPNPANTFEALLERLGNGFYLCTPRGGQTSGQDFTFGTSYGYEVRNGRLGAMVRDGNIMGNLFKTLSSIVAVGDTVRLAESGGCGKGQINIRSCHGGPHILVNDMVIGGRK